MRIGINSNGAHTTSAYGIQTRILAQHLQADGHDVAVFADYGHRGGILNIGGIPHYPAGRLEYSVDVLAGHVAHHGTQLLITLKDMMVVPGELIRQFRDAGVLVWHWMPVDCSPLGYVDRVQLQLGGGQPIAMSRFGERQLSDREWGGFDPWYVPHSIDTSLFTLDYDQRARLKTEHKLTRHFVVAMNAMNKSTTRKGFYEGFKAFASFHAKHPGSKLMLHTTDDGGGLDLAEALDVAGVPVSAVFNPYGDQVTQDYAVKTGMVTDAHMAAWYGLADVGLMPSWGEGFGIPAIEFQASGVPVIATDCTALSELTPPGISWRVKGQEVLNPDHKREWRIPSIPGLTRALGQAYQAWKTPGYAARRKRAREFALAYDADLVYQQYWAPLIKRAAEQCEDERTEGE